MMNLLAKRRNKTLVRCIMGNKIVVIDGNSIANRAFYALPLLSNDEGYYTNAVYGFLTMLLRMLDEEKPTHILVAFDAGKTTFRTKEYKDYKGKRLKTPGELSSQFPLIKDLLNAFDIKHYELEDYEADDIIGTITKEAEEKGFTSIIVSGDKDMLQLASDQTKIALTRKGITEVDWYTPKEIMEKYGLSPTQIIDLKGLMGDSSDNIPGIPGVGEKTALKLLHQYHSVEEVLANAEEVSGKKLQEKIRNHMDEARMSKELATILREAPIEISIEDILHVPYDSKKVEEALVRFGFKTILQRLGMDSADANEDTPTEDGQPFEYEWIKSEDSALLERLLHSPQALIVEIDGDRYHDSTILGLGLSNGENHVYLPFAMVEKWDDLQKWLANPEQKKWLYDGKRATVALGWKGIDLAGIEFDGLLASYLSNPTESRHALSDVAERYRLSLPSDENVYGKGAKRKVPDEAVVGRLIARKANALHHLRSHLDQEMEKQEIHSLFYDLELPLSFVLADMEKQGIDVAGDQLDEMGQALQGKLTDLMTQIYTLAGTEFNLNSPKQLGEILFDKLMLPVIKKTKTGYSTSADVLEKLKHAHEIIPLILEYRQLIKLQSTYIEGLKKEISEKTGKIHTCFNQAVTATGRLSSTEPNLQNIPIRLEEGRKIRQAFVPSEEGWLILAADYSQIELRIMAHISQDENLVDAFRQDMDIHTRTAMNVFGVEKEEVTGDMRRQAKAVNFGIIYGISDYGLSQNLNISRKEAAQFIEKYFSVFKGVKKFMEQIIIDAKEKGYVTTLLNRRRELPDIHSRNFNLRSFAERTAMNTPIQGSAADIIKLAMVKMAQKLKEKNLESRMLLQVHDELIFEVPPHEVEMMCNIVAEVMENALPLDVPLKVDIHYGPSWYEAK